MKYQNLDTYKYILKLEIQTKHYDSRPHTISSLDLWEMVNGEDGILIKRDGINNLLSITRIKRCDRKRNLSKSRVDIENINK